MDAIASQWELRPGVTYLNHGSWGPSPRPVLEERERWQRQLEEEPVDFFVRRFETDLAAASEKLGRFVGASGGDLVFMPNATVAMNHVAANIRLEPGDEVLATNHEYGAVQRIWREACRNAGAEFVLQRLPGHLDADAEIVDALFARCTAKTRLIVVSHVTSPTAAILPVAAICQEARRRGVPVCIDGPHAPLMVDVNIAKLGCDYYCASLHKWLSAPFGSGFLYIAKKRQQQFRPLVRSWGGSFSNQPPSWKDEFNWFGSYDPSPFLAVPAAIEFFEKAGIERFRERTHALARDVREKIVSLTGLTPLVADRPDRYGSMIALPLPPAENFEGGHGRTDPLQVRLWEEHRIEVPIMHWNGRRLLRVSCHLYNSVEQMDRLVEAIRSMKL